MLRMATFSILLLAAAATFVGCSREPVVSTGNLKYIQLMLTAVSSRDATKVDRVLESARAQTRAGAMSGPEFEAISRIGGLALKREWKAAEQSCLSLAKGQQYRRRPKSEAGPSTDPHHH